MTIADLRAEIDERLDDAAREAAESHKIAPNSYGAGYDAGFAAALRELRDRINGETT